MSKATKGTSTLFPQVSRGESNDAAKGLLDDAGDSSGDEAHYGSESLSLRPREQDGPQVDSCFLAWRGFLRDFR